MTGYVGLLENTASTNTDFRHVLYTGKHLQLVVMCLGPGEEIGAEVHEDVDQFFRIEQGTARFVLGDTEEHVVGVGGAVVVPAGTHHNVINASSARPAKLYTIYTPPQHPGRTVHRTKADAEAAEHQPA